jgi:hypothetical protein
LAHTAAFSTAAEIGDRLKRDGYTAGEVDIHLEGKSIKNDLARICREAIGGAIDAGLKPRGSNR